jgi:prepilin-type N-terminal cleavage/methylation domain-containing protein
MPRTRQKGFTLLEITIVMVIVGLLVSGVVKGQELVMQARMKETLSELNGLTGAYFAYLDRYRALPGDDLRADGRWQIFGAKSGNNDGVVGGAYDQTPPGLATFDPANTPAHESLNFWWHMRLAGFVSGSTTGQAAYGQPINSTNGMVGVQNGGLGLYGLLVCSQNLPDRIASAVDTQLDDQRSNTGSVRARLTTGNSSVPVGGPATDAAPNYDENGANIYVLCKLL